MRYVASRGLLQPKQITKLNFPLEGSGGAKIAMLEERPVLVADVRGETELARIFQELAKMAPEKTFDFIGSWICFPLHIGGKVEGLLDVCHPDCGFYTEDHVEILQRWISQVESTIENAILLTNLSQRSDELEMLNAIQQAIYSHLDLNDVLQLVADHALRLTSAHQIVIFVGDEEKLIAVTCAGDVHPTIQPGFTIPLSSTLVANALRNHQAMRVLNINRDTRIDPVEAMQLGICSLLVIPLRTAMRPNAILMAIGDAFGAFSPNDERVISSLAASAAISIDHAQLYQRERERRQLAEGVQNILAQLNSAQMLGEMLHSVLSITVDVLRADAGVVRLTETESHPSRLAIYQGITAVEFDRLQNIVDRAYANHFHLTAPESASAAPAILPLTTDLPGSGDITPILVDLRVQAPDSGSTSDTGISQLYAVALRITFTARNSCLGTMDLFWRQPRKLSPEEVQTVETINRYIAITIDQEQLKGKEQELVRLQERQRIAQNLHDTVTQLLFRTGLEAKWCLQHLDLVSEAQTRIETIQHLLTRSSYEMRSAIFALKQHEVRKGHNLLDLLQDQIADFQHEYGINATLVAREDLGDLPFPLVEAIYRLVREALNNIYKHANATAAFVSLKREENKILLTIQDDGSGLPEGQPLEPVASNLHFGVSSMYQLVAPFGGQLTIQNNDEQGVIVKAIFQIDWSNST